MMGVPCTLVDSLPGTTVQVALPGTVQPLYCDTLGNVYIVYSTVIDRVHDPRSTILYCTTCVLVQYSTPPSIPSHRAAESRDIRETLPKLPGKILNRRSVPPPYLFT